MSAGPYVQASDRSRQIFSSAIICITAILVAMTLPDGGSEINVYRHGAYAMGAGLLIAFLVEGSSGLRSLFRVDIIALFTLYFLTFAEFLHPHVLVLYQYETGGAQLSSELVLIGLAALAIGRHFPLPFTLGARTRLRELSSRQILWLFIALYALGFVWVAVSVEGDPRKLMDGLLAERFNRPWQRSNIGGWSSFLTELNLLLYPAFAIGGYVFAQGRRFSAFSLVCVAVLLLFCAFFDFAQGSRNVPLIRGVIFIVTYFIANRSVSSLRIIILSAGTVALLFTASIYMFNFRNMGLGAYLEQRSNITTRVTNEASMTFMLDNNLVSLARVTRVYPEIRPFPGDDVVLEIVAKWVPRALWPGKPVAWSDSIEESLGNSGATIAVTFVGEAYLIAGIPSLVIVSLLLGSLAATWTRIGVAARTNLDLIYYASGFFAAMLTMRSVQWITIAIVPTVALYVVARLFTSNADLSSRMYVR